jgi:hypothetical protein
MHAPGGCFVLIGFVATLAAGAASGQPSAPLGTTPLGPPPMALPKDMPEPTEADRREAIAELSQPAGIGGCVVHDIDPAVRVAVLTSIGLGQRSPDIAPAVAKVSAGCTGRPYSASDRALSTAVQGALLRTAVGIFFASELAIGERRLDAIWKSAPASEKAPFLRQAKAMLDPKATPGAVSLADTAPLARRLKILSNEPGRLAPVHQYYLGMALSEVAEAQLAAEGAQPP